jgi:hypothetical protein
MWFLLLKQLQCCMSKNVNGFFAKNVICGANKTALVRKGKILHLWRMTMIKIVSECDHNCTY